MWQAMQMCQAEASPSHIQEVATLTRSTAAADCAARFRQVGATQLCWAGAQPTHGSHADVLCMYLRYIQKVATLKKYHCCEGSSLARSRGLRPSRSSASSKNCCCARWASAKSSLTMSHCSREGQEFEGPGDEAASWVAVDTGPAPDVAAVHACSV